MFSQNYLPVRFRIVPFLGCIFAFAVCALSSFAQTGLDLQGKSVDPIAASAGKVSVLVFVRTDCPISNRYAPLLQKLSEEFADKAKFWLIYPDKTTTSQQISEHLRQFHYSISALRDPDRVLAKHAGVAVTPEAAVYDAQGKLVYHGRIDNLYVDAGRSRTVVTTHELKDAVGSAAFGKIPMPASVSAVGCYISDLE
jgi:thiol-disulfide isomerase/thioredoxin